jgi:hypothetical protein
VIIVFYSECFQKTVQLEAGVIIISYYDRFQEAVQLGAAGDHSSLILIVSQEAVQLRAAG